MLQRRFAGAALISVLCVAGFGGCQGETPTSGQVGQTSASATATPLDVKATRRGQQLVEHVQSTFLAEVKPLAVPSGKQGKTAKPIIKKPVLTASPIVSFNVDGNVIRPVALAAIKNEPVAAIGLPKVGNGPLTVAVSGISIEVRPRGFAATNVEWSDRIAVYPDVQEGTHAFRRVDQNGVEDFYEVATPRDELSFTYDVTMKDVSGLRLIDGSLELLDASGTPRLASNAPVVVDAKGVRRVGHLEVSGCAYDTNPAGPWGRAVTAPGNGTCVVTAKIDGRGLAFPVLVDPAWRPTYGTKQSHQYHKMFLLTAGADAGKVLLIGGEGSAPTTTELFDSATNTWALSSPIIDGGGLGEGCNAVEMADGTVYLGGGFAVPSGTNAKSTMLKRSTAGVWSYAAAMSVPRAWFSMHPVTVGGKAQILVAGGQKTDTLGSGTAAPLKTAELYDPALDAWIPTSSTMKYGHTKGGSAVLSGGKVLVAGGYSTTDTAAAAADVFDPATGTWNTSGFVMKSNRGAPIVVAASTGAVVFGGFDSTGDEVSQTSIEYWDGTTFTLLTAKLSEGRSFGAGVTTDDGRILIAGGQISVPGDFGGFDVSATATADLFTPGSDPKTGTLVDTVSMGTPRRWHALANLTGKGVLAAGGDDGSTAVTLSEIFDTTLGRACGAGCPSGTFCTEGVCCSTASCPEGQTCASPGHEGICTKPKGSACSSGTECSTGHCVENVCCDTACTGDCRSCATPGSVGTCSFAAVGTDPTGACFDSFDDPGCGAACDGAGSCSYYPPEGTACGAGGGDAASFCDRSTCDGFGYCESTTFDCGLTCTTDVRCNESTKTCTATATGIKAGYCVIDNTCLTYGDINPKNPCETCDPTTTGSKTSWSIAAACKEAGVEDTGVADAKPTDGSVDAARDTGTKDSGAADADAAKPDTSTAIDSAVVEDSSVTPEELPESSACSCSMPGNERGPSLAAGIALALAGLVVARRRNRR